MAAAIIMNPAKYAVYWLTRIYIYSTKRQDPYQILYLYDLPEKYLHEFRISSTKYDGMGEMPHSASVSCVRKVWYLIDEPLRMQVRWGAYINFPDVLGQMLTTMRIGGDKMPCHFVVFSP